MKQILSFLLIIITCVLYAFPNELSVFDNANPIFEISKMSKINLPGKIYYANNNKATQSLSNKPFMLDTKGEAIFNINVDKSDKYYIMVCCQPVNNKFSSSFLVYIDDKLQETYTFDKDPENNAMGPVNPCWTYIGKYDLLKGNHSVRFSLNEPIINNNYYQIFHSLNIISEGDLNFKIETEDIAPIKTSIQGASITETYYPKLISTTLKEKRHVSFPLYLMRNNYLVKEYYGNASYDPNSVVLPLTLNFHIPYDAPVGDYYLISPNFPNMKIPVSYMGTNENLVKREPNVKNINLKSLNKPKAGEDWNFDLKINNIDEINSDKLVMIFEKKKDVAYLGACAKISDKMTVNLPYDMPKGEYKVYCVLNKDLLKNNIHTFNINIQSDYNEENTKLKPICYGFYKDSKGQSQLWYSNQAHTLIWNGEPFMEISGMLLDALFKRRNFDERKDFEIFKQDIDKLEKHGIKYVYLYTGLSGGLTNNYRWEKAMDYLEERGFTYTIGYPYGDMMNYAAPTFRVIRANSDIIKIDKDQKGIITKEINILDYATANYPICQVDAVLLHDNAPFEIVPCKIIERDKDSYKVKVELDLSNYSETCDVAYSVRIVSNCGIGNYWKMAKGHISYMEDQIKSMALRPGFRGFIDMILPNERGIQMSDEAFSMDAKEYIEERAKRLKNKYKNINELKKEWKVLGDFVSTINEAATLYPIYADSEYMYLAKTVPYDSPVKKGEVGAYFFNSFEGEKITKQLEKERKNFSHKIYKVKATSPFWYEALQIRDESLRDIQNYMIGEVKKVCDVPVYIKAIGGSEYYNSYPEKNRKGQDGVGIEVYHSIDFLLNHGAGFRFGEVEASNKSMIFASTEINRSASNSMYPNYPDIQGFFFDMAVTHELGAKTTNIFTLDVHDNETFPNNRSIRDERMLEWMSIWHELINDKKDILADLKPYYYNSWPRCDLWWANPTERASVKWTDDASGMQNIKAPNGVWVINNFRADLPTDMTFVTLNDKPGSEYYKEDFEKLLKLNNREIVMCGLRHDRGTLSVDKYYTDNIFSDEEYNYQELKVNNGAEILHEKDGKVWAMKVGDLQIIACEPKSFNSLEEIVKYAKFSKVHKIGLDGKSYLFDVLKVKFATYGNNLFKGAEYNIENNPVTVIHTTDRKGGNLIKIKVKKDCHLYQFFTEISKDLKAGETIEIIFPENDVNNTTIGAGKGTVKIIGLGLDDFEIENYTKDNLLSKNEAGVEISALAEGLALPQPEEITEVANNSVEVYKALAGYQRGYNAYIKGDLYQAEEIWREYIPLAEDEMMENFCLGLGNCNLYHGHLYDTKNYYTDGLRVCPNSEKLKTAMGCLLYLSDKEAATTLWKECKIDEAKINLNKN